MTVTTTGPDQANPPLPQGVGRLSKNWILLVLVASAVAILGIVAYSYQLRDGLIVTGLRSLGTGGGSTWGVYVAFDVYFAGASFAGITIAALIRLLNIDVLKPLARMAEVLTVVSLLLASLAIMADVGQPLRAIENLLRYGRPQSPFFGTFSLVLAGYLFSSLIYLYLTSRRDASTMAKRPSRLRGLYKVWAAGWRDTPEQHSRDNTTSFLLAAAILPLLVVAHSTLGFVFGLQVGRPGWFGALQAPAFVALAGVSGIGHLVILAAIVRWVLHAKDRISDAAFVLLGRFLMVLTMIYLYFTAVEIFTTVYEPGATEKAISDSILTGKYAWIFWLSVLCLAVPAAALLVMALRRRWHVWVIVAAGAIANIGAIGKRYLIVVPSQTEAELLPYGVGSYTPNWVEVSVILGLFALGALMIAGFMKIFPIMELEQEED
jgi:molybdopterin-containing oxidoreductase family membrane subunit